MSAPEFLVFMTLLSAGLSWEQINICGNDIEWRNGYTWCYRNAVCGEVFTSYRLFENFSTCRETHSVHHCYCRDGGTCPIDNPTYELSALWSHKLYLCQPKCNLDYCPYRATISMTTLRTTYPNGSFFANFKIMNCRCPRHHRPTLLSSYQDEAVMITPDFYFVCQNTQEELSLRDPCLAD